MLRRAVESDIEIIRPYVEHLNLDIFDMDYQKFYIYEHEGLIAGFGRYKNMGDYYELATIGVLEPFRRKGIGKKIVNQLLNTIPAKEIWLTTIIPEYFQKFGFKKINDNIPIQLRLKTRNICRNFNKSENLSVYMKFKKNLNFS